MDTPETVVVCCFTPYPGNLRADPESRSLSVCSVAVIFIEIGVRQLGKLKAAAAAPAAATVRVDRDSGLSSWQRASQAHEQDSGPSVVEEIGRSRFTTDSDRRQVISLELQ